MTFVIDDIVEQPGTRDINAFEDFVFAPAPARPDGRRKTGVDPAARIRWHLSMPPIRTPRIDQVSDTLSRLLIHAQFAQDDTASTGLAVSGLPYTGKTSAVKQWAKQFARQAYRDLGLPDTERTPVLTTSGDRGCPVIYVTLAGRTRVRGLNDRIVRWVNAPPPVSQTPAKRSTADTLRQLSLRIMSRGGTRVLICDNAESLRTSRTEDVLLGDHIKELTDELNIVPLLVGVDLTGPNKLLYDDGHGDAKKNRSRFELIEFAPYRFSKNGGQLNLPWQRLLATYEHKLMLENLRESTLVKRLAKYLHRRTGGIHGALHHLIVHGANLAIKRGTEQLTVALLDDVPMPLEFAPAAATS